MVRLSLLPRIQAPRSLAAASMRMKKAWPSVATPAFYARLSPELTHAMKKWLAGRVFIEVPA